MKLINAETVAEVLKQANVSADVIDAVASIPAEDVISREVAIEILKKADSENNHMRAWWYLEMLEAVKNA